MASEAVRDTLAREFGASGGVNETGRPDHGAAGLSSLLGDVSSLPAVDASAPQLDVTRSGGGHWANWRSRLASSMFEEISLLGI